MEKASTLTNIEYQQGTKPAANVLFVSDFTREIRFVFQQGQLMKKHQTPFPIVIEVVNGKIDFGIDGRVETLVSGDLVALDGGIAHDLVAQTDSIVRLTMSLTRTIDREGNKIED